MRARRALAAAAALGAVLAFAADAATEAPAVSRPHYESGDGASAAVAGTAFFLATPSGAVAVGSAHSYDRAKLAASDEISFELARTRRGAGRASRVLVEPGLAFSEPGGSLATDLVVFALDAPPAAARALEAGALPRRGERVRLLGIPASLPRDEEETFGKVASASPDRLEVMLDAWADLRGWGGAPVLSHPEGRVVGLVQGAVPDGKRLRVLATPIGAVTEALARSLDAARGRPLAALAEPGAPGAPAPGAAATSPPVARERRVVAGDLAIEIEHPGNGAIVGDPLGAFVSGRATADPTLPDLEVAFVIDTSGSARAPSGMDVNGNGIVGDDTFAEPGTIHLGSTDPGDSVLAAEIAAARHFLARLDPRHTRVSVITYAGRDFGSESFEQIDPDSVLTEIALTDRHPDIERALERVLQRGAEGATYMAGGVDRAIAELLGERGAASKPDPKAEKLVVFLTDGQPTLPRLTDPNAAVLRAAQRAEAAGIRFFTFGIGEDALSRSDTIARLAAITHGAFTPVHDVARLGDLVAQAELAGIAEVTLRNETLGAPAHVVELAADGGFGAMVPLGAGKNVVTVTAIGGDGRGASKSITLHYAPDAVSPPLPPALLARRNRLLEDRLVRIKRDRLAAEDAQTEQLRRALETEIARAREERRRKELALEVEKEKRPSAAAP